ncbi:putative triple gene block 2 [Gentian ovary ringspot virus]|uniref:Putative triple gene block 2 n=1 Tax=Gentian ovary ringspot virus TaxID=1920772 RepID=A0A077JIF7_9VIRU|nr:putative triple gene block 2 [Gentian ovary ringspot virus]BAP18646.1 putative triple gene block 2 [Gentian ovary ringspot virus]
MPKEVATRPNKAWPVVIGIAIVGLFLYLGSTHQKHATSSGDNIHKFSNGGTYRDGTKSISYNKNNNRAYNNGSSGDRTSAGLLLLLLCTTCCVWIHFQAKKLSECSDGCIGRCLVGGRCV